MLELGSRAGIFFPTLPRLSSWFLSPFLSARAPRPPATSPSRRPTSMDLTPVGLTPSPPLLPRRAGLVGPWRWHRARPLPPPPPPAFWWRGSRRRAGAEPDRPSWSAWTPPVRSRWPSVCLSGCPPKRRVGRGRCRPSPRPGVDLMPGTHSHALRPAIRAARAAGGGAALQAGLL